MSEIIEKIKANMDYELNQIRRRISAVDDYKKQIKVYEAKIKELSK